MANNKVFGLSTVHRSSGANTCEGGQLVSVEVVPLCIVISELQNSPSCFYTHVYVCTWSFPPSKHWECEEMMHPFSLQTPDCRKHLEEWKRQNKTQNGENNLEKENMGGWYWVRSLIKTKTKTCPPLSLWFASPYLGLLKSPCLRFSHDFHFRTSSTLTVIGKQAFSCYCQHLCHSYFHILLFLSQFPATGKFWNSSRQTKLLLQNTGSSEGSFLTLSMWSGSTELLQPPTPPAQPPCSVRVVQPVYKGRRGFYVLFPGKSVLKFSPAQPLIPHLEAHRRHHPCDWLGVSAWAAGWGTQKSHSSKRSAEEKWGCEMAGPDCFQH